MGRKDEQVKWHLEILGIKQKSVIKRQAVLLTDRQFYLAGGTALALYFGHRHSVDFDWFTEQPIKDPLRLAREIQDAHRGFSVTGTDRGTLHGIMSGVRISFIEYRYPLLSPLCHLPEYGCHLASLDDLACMKLSAIAQRGTKKDFIDLYFLGIRHRSLLEMLNLYQEKYNIKDMTSVLYGLVYFDDAEGVRMPRMLSDIRWQDVKNTIKHWVKDVTNH